MRLEDPGVGARNPGVVLGDFGGEFDWETLWIGL